MAKTQSNNTKCSSASLRQIDLNAGRRAFLRSCGLAAAGAAALGGLVGSATDAEAQVGSIDANILNFALNLEYLEAEFYLLAAFGVNLPPQDTTGTGNLGPVIGGRKVNFTNGKVKLYAEEIAGDEFAHVRFLRAALGAQRVARPRIDLQSSFTAAARAAGLIGPNDQFDAFANDTTFLLAAFIFEDVGVTAYKGAARFITSKDVLEAAAGILAVEAYHAANIRTVLFALELIAEARAISDARDSLDGPSDLDQGIYENGQANIVPADANGIAFSRSTDKY